jgi:hypothetical protein
MRRRSEANYDGLVLAIATGGTVKAWSEANGIPYTTAQKWHNTDEFRSRVQEVRLKLLDTGIGIMVEGVADAARKMVELSQGADTDAVKLSACRGLLDDIIKISGYAQLKTELTELREQVARLVETQANAGIQPTNGTTRLGVPESDH